MSSSTGNMQKYEQRQPKKISNSAELYKLPKNQYTLMELILETKELSYTTLCDRVKALDDDKRLSQAQIDGTLYELIRIGYLTSFMEKGDIIYMAQIANKGDSPIKRDEQKIWSKMDMSALKDLLNKKKNDPKQ